METFDSVKVFTHPQYNVKRRHYNYALVKLSGKSSITPVPMDSEKKTDTYTSATELTAIGKSNLLRILVSTV